MSFLQDDKMNAVLDSIWGSGAPGTFYLALLQVLPDTAGVGAVEADYTGYARVAVTNNATEWPAASGGQKTNANPISYGIAGSGPQDVVGVAFVDDPTDPIDATNLTAVVDLTGAPVTITNGANVAFGAETLDLTRCL